jgi:hypothetical protein
MVPARAGAIGDGLVRAVARPECRHSPRAHVQRVISSPPKVRLAQAFGRWILPTRFALSCSSPTPRSIGIVAALCSICWRCYPRGRNQDHPGEKRHGKQAAAFGCMFSFRVYDLWTVRRSRRGSWFLPTLRAGRIGPGAQSISRPALRRGPARRSLVDGFFHSLRVVPRRRLGRNRRRTGRTHAVCESMQRPVRAKQRRDRRDEDLRAGSCDTLTRGLRR